MFAHQVTEDLRHDIKTLSNSGIENDYTRYMQAILGKCERSIKFHIEDEDDFIYFRANALNKEYAFMKMPEYLKVPYKDVYIDYACHDGNQDPNYKVSKIAAIIKDCGSNILAISLLAFKSKEKKWFLSPVLYHFKCGEYFNNCSANCVVIYSLPVSDTERDAIAEEDRVDITILNNFLLLLNCKNIQTEKIPAPEALNKKRRKAGKQELFDYHVLNVVVPSKKRDYREATTPLSHNRVHLCRGHFKEYTAEHPLFGHYTGLFWWQPHVRGQNKDGIVMKDYNVRPN